MRDAHTKIDTHTKIKMKIGETNLPKQRENQTEQEKNYTQTTTWVKYESGREHHTSC